jgi:hypothetical protein
VTRKLNRPKGLGTPQPVSESKLADLFYPEGGGLVVPAWVAQRWELEDQLKKQVDLWWRKFLNIWWRIGRELTVPRHLLRWESYDESAPWCCEDGEGWRSDELEREISSATCVRCLQLAASYGLEAERRTAELEIRFQSGDEVVMTDPSAEGKFPL